MERRLADGVCVEDEVGGVGVVPLDVGQQLLDDGEVAPPARLVQRSLPALSPDKSKGYIFGNVNIPGADIIFGGFRRLLAKGAGSAVCSCLNRFRVRQNLQCRSLSGSDIRHVHGEQHA